MGVVRLSERVSALMDGLEKPVVSLIVRCLDSVGGMATAQIQTYADVKTVGWVSVVKYLNVRR